MINFARFNVLVAALGFSLSGMADVTVSTLVNLDASGGVTLGPDGYIYVSDFGPQLGPSTEPTNVYRVNPDTGDFTVFAGGFDGASGATFDNAGNFYQAEPRGNRVTRITPEGERSVVAEGLNTPVGVQVDTQGNVLVCNCTAAEIVKITPDGEKSVFVHDADLLQCPNGLTQDDAGNFYAVTFGAGNVLKISAAGEMAVLAELPVLAGGPNPVGLGHITYANDRLYVTAIGIGVIYEVSLDGVVVALTGRSFAFANVDGIGSDVAFSKPNGIAASADGRRLFVNVSDPGWPVNPAGLYPASLRVISGF